MSTWSSAVILWAARRPCRRTLLAELSPVGEVDAHVNCALRHSNARSHLSPSDSSLPLTATAQKAKSIPTSMVFPFKSLPFAPTP